MCGQAPSSKLTATTPFLFKKANSKTFAPTVHCSCRWATKKQQAKLSSSAEKPDSRPVPDRFIVPLRVVQHGCVRLGIVAMSLGDPHALHVGGYCAQQAQGGLRVTQQLTQHQRAVIFLLYIPVYCGITLKGLSDLAGMLSSQAGCRRFDPGLPLHL
jgi:hypothetical protein